MMVVLCGTSVYFVLNCVVLNCVALNCNNPTPYPFVFVGERLLRSLHVGIDLLAGGFVSM